MTKSEWAIEELRLALGPINFQRAQEAVRALEETRTINGNQADQIVRALGSLRDVMKSFAKP